MSVARRFGASALAIAIMISPTLFASAAERSRTSSAQAAGVLYAFELPDGRSAIVYANGVAQVFSKDRRKFETRLLQSPPRYDGRSAGTGLPDKWRAIAELETTPTQEPFAENRVIVVYRDGVVAPQDVISAATGSLAKPAYTNSIAVNRALASIGVDRSERLFRHINRAVLSALRGRASAGGAAVLNFANAYRLHVSGASVRQAVAALSKLSAVAYVSPDWNVSAMRAPSTPIDRAMLEASKRRQLSLASESASGALALEAGSDAALRRSLPSNYALTSSAQSLFNSPSVDAAAAWAEVKAQFRQLPGQGETITDVSLGDLDDATATSKVSDPCYGSVGAYGPTTILRGGQRYLNLPSMPLIPTYTADLNGNVNGAGEVCGVDPSIAEIGLDFSMMAPLPHNQQRPGEQGAGYTDLLGIAPGAGYRLVVPASSAPTIADIDAALLAAGLQTPQPDVIAASLAFSYDSVGFPSRYLEEDPLTEAIVQSIVSRNIVVCIAANDGTRTTTSAAIGPSGGSVPTDALLPAEAPTSLADDYSSTVPSRVFDSGSIAVGGTTLDDIFAEPPQYASTPQGIAQHAYAETRWTGFTSFSSGFGSRVDVSAPSDNVLSIEHALGPSSAADTVAVALSGGTSASAPEVAAAAAVMLQVAKLTGHPLADPLALRKLLKRTASRVHKVTQADRGLHVGPQIDLRAAVEQLLEKGGLHPLQGVARVAVEQRRDYSNLDASFLGDTNSASIDLAGPSGTGQNQLAWITIAPDWTGIPKDAVYRLFVNGHAGKPLAPTPWARLLPVTILQAAGLPLVSASSRTVKLTYEALSGKRKLASASVTLTLGPATAVPDGALAPEVPPVVTGAMIPVRYDVSNVGDLSNPRIVVSEPGRVDLATGLLWHPAYTAPLPSQKRGTVNIPVSALQGGGIYGIDIELSSTGGIYSDFAFTRVAPAGANRPNAPLLSSNLSTAGHILEIPYGGSFQVQYDVRNVPGATGAALEISAAGPGTMGIRNPFNNPNGTIRDRNGLDTGSIYFARLARTSGTATIDAVTAGLLPALDHVVRVIPIGPSGKAVGEGGDVSTVTMDGVAALDGGSASNGWGINQSGSDAFITSSQTEASGLSVSSLETFDQTTNRIVQNVAAGSNDLYFTNGWGIYSGDIGVFGNFNTLTAASAYNLLDTVASGTIGASWTPPMSYEPPSAASPEIVEGAANQDTDTAAFLTLSLGTGAWGVFTSNVVANTFSSVFDIMGPAAGFLLPNFGGIAENTSAKTAVLPLIDAGNFCGTPTMVTVDLASGAVGSFAGVGSGYPYGIAVDSVSNKAAVPTICDNGFSIYDLSSGVGREVFLPGSGNANGFYTAADPKAKRFLVEQTFSPNWPVDNNSLSRVLVYDENGNLLKTLERFSLFNTFLGVQNNSLQLNPTTRTGYLIGPFQQQLVPFKY